MTAPVALLVPCHNAARFVPRFLGLVAAQRVPYAEVLFYDDASTDGTAGLLQAAGVQVLRGERNRGAAFARNRLLEASRSPHVHFHDVDDDLDPDFLRELAPLLGPDTAACCAYERVHPDGSVTEVDRFTGLEGCRQRVGYFVEHFLTFNAAIYPRAALTAAGGFPEHLRLSEDLHLLLRLAASPLRFRYRDRVLTRWLLRPDSTHHSAGKQRRAEATLECFLHLSRQLPPGEARQLGRPLLELAWDLLSQEQGPGAVRAAETAERIGEWVIRNRGKRLLLYSLLLGPARTYQKLVAGTIARRR